MYELNMSSKLVKIREACVYISPSQSPSFKASLKLGTSARANATESPLK